jgi:hypothetical protein
VKFRFVSPHSFCNSPFCLLPFLCRQAELPFDIGEIARMFFFSIPGVF